MKISEFRKFEFFQFLGYFFVLLVELESLCYHSGVILQAVVDQEARFVPFSQKSPFLILANFVHQMLQMSPKDPILVVLDLQAQGVLLQLVFMQFCQFFLSRKQLSPELPEPTKTLKMEELRCLLPPSQLGLAWKSFFDLGIAVNPVPNI